MTIIPQPTKRALDAEQRKALQKALHDAAQRYIARGWHLIVLKPNSKVPHQKWADKTTLITTPEAANTAWNERIITNFNIGIECGQSGLYVFDFDTAKKNYGPEAEALRQQIHNLPLSHRPPFYRSRSGGYHYYFRHNHTADPLPKTEGILAPCVDTQGLGAYIVAPPSIVKEDNKKHPLFEHYAQYQTDNDSMTFEVIPTIPDWLLDRVRAALAPTPRTEAPIPQPQPTTRPTTAPAGGFVDDDGVFVDAYKWFDSKIEIALNMVRMAVDGQRHGQRYDAGRLLGGALATMRMHGYAVMSDDEAINTLYNANIPASGSQRKERKTIADGLELGLSQPLQPQPRRTPVKAPQRPTEAPNVQMLGNDTDDGNEAIGWRYPHRDPRQPHLSDIGNGERFVDAAGGRLMYIIETNQWYLWSGQRWEKTAYEKIQRLAQYVAKSFLLEAYAAPDDKREQYTRWAASAQSAGKVEAMLQMARPHLAHAIDILDAENKAHLLTVANGTIDLRTGNLYQSTPDNHITKMTPIYYDPTATAPRWHHFLGTIFHGDLDLIRYVQMAVGYSLTASNDSQCLFFLYGNGANGKSTFINVLERLLTVNEYYKPTAIDALLVDKKQDGEKASPFLVDMVGMRLITANELPANRRLNESMVKHLTGGELMPARQLYGKPFSFRPQFKLWISGNHKPRIGGQDHGIWRRVRLIPFTYTFTAAEQRAPTEVMREFMAELPGILAWAVRGAVEWYAQGDQRAAFTPPAAVVEAVEEYREEEDIIRRFIVDCCEIGPEYDIQRATLYTKFTEWATLQGERSAREYNQNTFTRALKTKGEFKDYGAGNMKLRGLRLRSNMFVE